MIDYELPFGHGYFDVVELEGDILNLGGWMFLPGSQIDKFMFQVNERPAGKIGISERPDVQKVFPFVPNSQHSGFNFSTKLNEPSPLLDICVIAMKGDKQVAKLRTLYSKEIA